MKTTKVLLIVMLNVACLFLNNVQANNIVVSNATLTSRDVPSNTTMVTFNLDWDNSWRSAAGPGPINWDAAYVFVKYKIVNSPTCAVTTQWKHASLDTNNIAANHFVTTDNGVPATFAVARRDATQGSIDKGIGVFIYRTNTGIGSINWDEVKIRWEYGLDGVCDDDEVSVKVFAIEMVYVPTESFELGDGDSFAESTYSFHSGTTNSKVTINTALTGDIRVDAGGSQDDNQIKTIGVGVDGDGGIDNDDNGSIDNPLYPTGYNGFWCMKYECSQEQWVEFLNTLTPDQQLNLTTANLAGEFAWQDNQYAPDFRNGVKCQTPPNTVTGTPGLYRCDLDDDDTYNETTIDGRYVPMNYVQAQDAMAYLDWAGLRPMTETEYEKASRGNQTAIQGEYAWGSTAIHASSYWNLTNGGGIDELPNNPSVGANGNCVYQTTVPCCPAMPNGDQQSPLRCGIFATATSTRVTAGATFYGIMEMSGNLSEMTVHLGSVAGRSYTGLHGDGSLYSATVGYAKEDYWPGMNNNSNYAVANGTTNYCNGYAGIGLRGGNTNSSTAYLRVSDRQYNGMGWYGRQAYYGFRGVRTASSVR